MCTCNACNPSQVTPLPREKWVVGQRVALTWHRIETHPNMPQGDPVEVRGTIVPRPPKWHQNSEGVMFSPDNLHTRIFWIWDFVLEGGGANDSPLYEIDAKQYPMPDVVRYLDDEGYWYQVRKENVK